MIDTTITFAGNLVDNPEIRATPNGNFVCNFRLAATSRRFDRAENRWVDGTTLFLRVTCWRQLAENVSASLGRGDRALVIGRLRQHSYETAHGERRTTYEVEADSVGAELVWHPVRFQRANRMTAGEATAEPGRPHSETALSATAQPEVAQPGRVEPAVGVTSDQPSTAEGDPGEPDRDPFAGGL
jgi:single-strand DNA-binding protein